MTEKIMILENKYMNRYDFGSSENHFKIGDGVFFTCWEHIYSGEVYKLLDNDIVQVFVKDIGWFDIPAYLLQRTSIKPQEPNLDYQPTFNITPLCSPEPAGRLSFCIGLPRSGKSTFCKQWQIESSKRVVLSGDDFRYAVYNQRWQRQGEELVRATLMTAARALYRAGYDVMIDETNTSESSIRHILDISQSATAFYFTTSVEKCVNRAIACNQLDLPPSIRRMGNNLVRTQQDLISGHIPVEHIQYIHDV